MSTPGGFKNTTSASRLRLARQMTHTLAADLPDRPSHVVADSSYTGGGLCALPEHVAATSGPVKAPSPAS